MLRRMSRNPPASPPVERALKLLGGCQGDLRIVRLSEQLGISEGHLIRSFNHRIGVTPKRYARILRFHRLIGLVQRAGPVHWAALASELGYTDQAHLIKEFRGFTGITPGQFLAVQSPDGENLIGD
jgi:AraC-like DNA-binding protein